MIRAIRAEFAKLKGSKVLFWTVLAVVGLAAIVIAGTLWSKTGDANESMAKWGGAWTIAAEAGLYTPTWENAVRSIAQDIAAKWGVLLFGFVAAYVFGRERKEGTDAALLTAPVRRRSVVLAKMSVTAVWALALTLSFFVSVVAGFAIIGMESFAWEHVVRGLGQTLEVALLIYLTLPLVAFVALTGKPGYLRPMLYSTVVWIAGMSFSMTSGASLFPWAMPTLIAGSAYIPIPTERLAPVSWAISIAVFAVGAIAVVWRFGRASDVG